ncbi:hypothetical protein GpartN1_g1066.t1 [Galdieria partita]|uniref:Alpha-MPP n=1 Tax=Galdieria partita TaxID=83374 RepID=A0A9C7PRP1_9RHOD|nr:hypothetical protein GpartN1_g1066.t1 [Galdieria partita]
MDKSLSRALGGSLQRSLLRHKVDSICNFCTTSTDSPSARVQALAPRDPSHDGPKLWKRLHGLFDHEVPLTDPFPGVPEPELISAPQRGPHLITTLSNGIRVISQDLGGQVSSLGLYVDAGSRDEIPQLAGATHFLEHMAFKSTTKRSHFMLSRDLEKLGATVGAAASRESLSYTAECLRKVVPGVVEAIAETVLYPRFRFADSEPMRDLIEAEIQEQKKVVEKEVKDLSADSQTKLMESLHAAAYDYRTLGLPLVAEERKLEMIRSDVLTAFMQLHFTPDRMIFSATNVEHQEIVQLVDKFFGSMEASPRQYVRPKAVYTGGEARLAGDGPVQVAIAFQGVPWKDKDLIPACILHTLLGGGGSFSAGGPGKGMYSRLYTSLLVGYPWIISATAFNHCYTDSGLFGIHCSADPERTEELLEILMKETKSMKQALNERAVRRAKKMTKSSLLMNLESRAVVCEDLGRQILTSGQYLEPDKLASMVDKVKTEDLERVIDRMLSSKPTLAIYGDHHGLPSYTEVTAGFKQGAVAA